MYFLIENNDLLEKHNTIWDRVSADIKKEFDRKPVYNKKIFENQIKAIKLQIFTVISLDSAPNKDENYYPQVFLKECK